MMESKCCGYAIVEQDIKAVVFHEITRFEKFCISIYNPLLGNYC
jgi:hypothetical protein